MLAEIANELPKADAVIPVPSHGRRLLKRGFNQCAEMGKTLSRLAGIPLESDILLITQERAVQHNLSQQERFRNLSGAFMANSKKKMQ